MTNVVTRIAPSPTGMMHIGTARTALFNYLYARHMGGKFLLRIEDTDRDRSTKEAVDVILDGLNWLGLDYDGEVVFQSSRMSRHIEVAYEMLERGAAYKCYLKPEDAAKMKTLGSAFRSPWRKPDYKGSEPLDDLPFVIRFKGPMDGETVLRDLVKGDIRFENRNLDDLVLLRADGTPTYNLAVVVDDHDMGITHVIRGDDHVNNTPRQILIYEAMGWDLPSFGHIPLIFTEAGKKYSKREGAAAITDWRDAGYLPETMRNYLTRLGWGHGDDELFTDAEAIEWFDIVDVLSSPARFNKKKLDSVNQHYISTADNDSLTGFLLPLLNKHGIWLEEHIWRGRFENEVVQNLKVGPRTLNELADMMLFVFGLPDPFEDKAIVVLSAPEALARLRWAHDVLDLAVGVEGWWTVDNLNTLIHDHAEKDGYAMKEIGPVMRAALTGRTSAPDLGTCLAAIGESESIRRIIAAMGQVDA